ncbi:MAG: hypothetical protein AAGI34_03000 [Pseudomonadota bacterium]
MSKTAKLGRCRSYIGLLLVAYVVIAIHGDLYSKNKEWFPFFSWSLFTRTHFIAHDAVLEIVSADGKRFDPPVDYFKLPELFSPAAANSASVVKLTRKMAGRHYGGKDLSELEARLNNVYLNDVDTVHWQLVHVVHYPIERYRSGQTLRRTVLMTGVKTP